LQERHFPVVGQTGDPANGHALEVAAPLPPGAAPVPIHYTSPALVIRSAESSIDVQEGLGVDNFLAWGGLVLVLLAITVICVWASRKLGGVRRGDPAEMLAAKRAATNQRDAGKAAGYAAWQEERMRGGGYGP
jgi:hypothetical protein